MKDLQPSDRDIAKRMLQTIFPEDEDEDEHTVQKKESRMVSVCDVCQPILLMQIRVSVSG